MGQLVLNSYTILCPDKIAESVRPEMGVGGSGWRDIRTCKNETNRTFPFQVLKPSSLSGGPGCPNDPCWWDSGVGTSRMRGCSLPFQVLGPQALGSTEINPSRVNIQRINAWSHKVAPAPPSQGQVLSALEFSRATWCLTGALGPETASARGASWNFSECRAL